MQNNFCQFFSKFLMSASQPTVTEKRLEEEETRNQSINGKIREEIEEKILMLVLKKFLKYNLGRKSRKSWEVWERRLPKICTQLVFLIFSVAYKLPVVLELIAGSLCCYNYFFEGN